MSIMPILQAMHFRSYHIFQASCPVLPSDTPDEVAAKVHALEYAHYPHVIESLL